MQLRALPKEKGTASTGWETFLTAVIDAGLRITGTWPMRTELSNRMVSSATNALASTLDLDWIINGDSNTLDFGIDYDLGTSYVDIDGDSNSVTFDGSGYQSGYFYLDQTGNGRTYNITQSSTLASDWLKIISTGDNGTVCVVQNDGGTSTGC